MPYKKPSRVRFYGVAAFADGVQLDRVQAIGSTSRLNTEDIREMGNVNIVELVDDVPQVDVSCDTNDFGSLKTLATFVDKSFGLQVLAVPQGTVGQTAYSQITPGTNKVRIYAGSYVHNGVRLPVVQTDIIIPSAGTHKVYLPAPTAGALTPTLAATVPGGGVPLATVVLPSGSTNVTQPMITDDRTFKTIALTDFEYAFVDITVPVKAPSSTSVERTMYLENVFVNRFDMSYQVRGVVTENYGMETDNKRWFLNSGAQVVEKATVLTAAQTAVTLQYTPAALNNGKKMLKVRLGQGGATKDLVEGTDFTIAGTTVTLVGQTIAAGDVLMSRYSTAPQAGAISVPLSTEMHPFPPAALKHGQVEVYLNDDASNPVLRVQNVRVSASLRRTPLQELGHFNVYDRPLELPVEVTVSLDVMDSDLDLFARMAGATYSAATGVTGVNEIAITDLLWNKSLTIKMFRETDERRDKLPAGHPFKYPMKTVTIDNLYATSDRWEVRTGGDASQTLDFKAYNLTITSGIGG